MARMRNLIKLAIAAGPTIYQVLRKYWPVIKDLLETNPEIVDRITGRVRKLAKTAKGDSVDDLNARIEVLREQVTYVYASADNAAEAEEAKKWRTDVESIERAIPVLNAMNTKQKKTEIARLSKRIDQLSAKILSASIREDIEDAEIEDEN